MMRTTNLPCNFRGEQSSGSRWNRLRAPQPGGTETCGVKGTVCATALVEILTDSSYQSKRRFSATYRRHLLWHTNPPFPPQCVPEPNGSCCNPMRSRMMTLPRWSLRLNQPVSLTNPLRHRCDSTTQTRYQGAPARHRIGTTRPCCRTWRGRQRKLH